MPPSRRRIRIAVAVVLVLLFIGNACRPYVRHDFQAASYARTLAQDLDETADFRIHDVDSDVDHNPGGASSYCWFRATVVFTSSLNAADAEAKAEEVMSRVADTYMTRAFASRGTDDGRNRYELTTGRLAEGGSWDLRCA